MITTIVTTRQTTLTISASEILNLEQIGHDHRIELSPGVNKVPIGVGLFRVLSTEESVHVSADTADTQIVAFTKDGNGSPDPPKLRIGVDTVAINRFINATALKIGRDPKDVGGFISNAASEPAPE